MIIALFPVLVSHFIPHSHQSKILHRSPSSEPVHDLAFAPNFGRSYHLLAIASRDVKIVSLKPVTPGKDANVANFSNYSKFEIRQIASFNEHNSQVWSIASSMRSQKPVFCMCGMSRGRDVLKTRTWYNILSATMITNCPNRVLLQNLVPSVS